MANIQVKSIGFDGPPVALVRNFLDFNEEYHQKRLKQYKRDFKMFNAILDMTNRDPERANIFIPKIMQIIRNKVPRYVKALYGFRPYLPFQAKKKDFREAVSIWVDYIDELLETGNWYVNGVLATILKCTYGTSFVDYSLYYKPQIESFVQMTPMGPAFGKQKVHRLAAKLQTYAPWEVIADRYAKNLEEEGGCRAIVKVVRASKRHIKKMALRGAYGRSFDVAALDHKTHQLSDSYITKADWGWQVLAGVGFEEPAHDDDMCILLRYESEERLIDCFNGKLSLRDVPNEHPTGLIPTSRYIHDMDAHTANQFHGTSEVKPNEVFQHLKNHLYNQAIDIWNMISQPMIYYKRGAGINVNDLIYQMGQRVGVGGDPNEPIEHFIKESAPKELPQSYFLIDQQLDTMMDDTATLPDVSQGKIPEGDPTATATVKADERASGRYEMDITLSEHMFLGDFGRKFIGFVCNVAGLSDLVASVGLERAIHGFFQGNPNDVPDGFDMKFKGSNHVANQMVKQKNWIALRDMYFNNPQVSQEWVLKNTLQMFDMDDPDAMDAIYPDQLMALLLGMTAGVGGNEQGAPVKADGDKDSATRRMYQQLTMPGK